MMFTAARATLSDQERTSWVSRKASTYSYAEVMAGRLGPIEGEQHREALVQELLSAYRGRCNSFSTGSPSATAAAAAAAASAPPPRPRHCVETRQASTLRRRRAPRPSTGRGGCWTRSPEGRSCGCNENARAVVREETRLLSVWYKPSGGGRFTQRLTRAARLATPRLFGCGRAVEPFPCLCYTPAATSAVSPLPG